MHNGNIRTQSESYLNANYWAPLSGKDDEDEEEVAHATNEDIRTKAAETLELPTAVQAKKDFQNRFRQWVGQQWGINPKHASQSMVIDSGATSHFVWLGDNLPVTGASDKLVTLPNGHCIPASHTVNLPFESLQMPARTAHDLPNLTTNSLVSVPKLADAGYTTIFHPGDTGVTIHGSGDVVIQHSSSPVLQGWQDDAGLWRLGFDEKSSSIEPDKDNPSATTTHKNDSAANVYTLPSIKQGPRFLHAVAGFPTIDSWLKAVELGH